MTRLRRVSIHYLRLPDRSTVYEQEILHESPDVVVTWQAAARLDKSVQAGGRTVLEDGSPVVWFTFPGAAHDIGRFHLADGTFTGFYANILTPVDVEDDGTSLVIWRTTDLFLDLFLREGEEPLILDRAEFDRAEATGVLSPELARLADDEAGRVTRKIGEGQWPPPITSEWTLERARQVAGIAG